MTDQLGLFEPAEAWHGDPVRPALSEDEPHTPPELVATLTRADRKLRLAHLVDQAHAIVDLAKDIHAGGRTIVGEALLFSGGNDSTTMAHIFRGRATHAIHANTGIGIEATRVFVRETCAAWGIPLIEKHPPPGSTYRELVVDQGFPGPAMHWKVYQRLKERALRQARAELVKNHRRERVVFIAGRRREESERREDIPLMERDGSVIWASPMALWNKLDMTLYRSLHDVPQSTAAQLIHMSGECLCGAFAKPGELEEIGEWFPEVVAEIREHEAAVRAAGHHPDICVWGHGKGRKADRRTGPLCTSCDARFLPLFADDGDTLTV